MSTMLSHAGKIVIALCVTLIAGSNTAFADEKTGQAKGTKSGTQTPRSKPEQELLSPQAKVSFEQAEKLAQDRAPGRTEEIELEREKGKLVYSVEIIQAGKKFEICIDAVTGQILKVDSESMKQEKEDEKKDPKNRGGKVK